MSDLLCGRYIIVLCRLWCVGTEVGEREGKVMHVRMT
jgi:hypothetical protein